MTTHAESPKRAQAIRWQRKQTNTEQEGRNRTREASGVRLRRRAHSRVRVPARWNVHPPETEGYCVVAARGGELPEVNNPSVTTCHPYLYQTLREVRYVCSSWLLISRSEFDLRQKSPKESTAHDRSCHPPGSSRTKGIQM